MEYARTPTSFAALVVDVDDAAAGEHLGAAVDNGAVCEPNWVVMRRASGGIHPVWTLSAPVHRYPTARRGPLAMLARVSEYYAAALGGDAAYSGVLAHNPMAAGHRGTCITTWRRQAPYPLRELAARIPAGWRQPAVPRIRTAAGRNCALFLALCRFGGMATNSEIDVSAHAARLNEEFACRLDRGELQGIVRSVLHYRRRWIADGWHQPSFLARQAARGRRGGRVSKGGGRPCLFGRPMTDAERKRRQRAGVTKQANTGLDGRGAAAGPRPTRGASITEAQETAA